LGDSLLVLKEGRPARVQYETRFIVNWPDHLGGGDVFVDLEGTMVLVPLLSFA
jgi:hypothetical protein